MQPSSRQGGSRRRRLFVRAASVATASLLATGVAAAPAAALVPRATDAQVRKVDYGPALLTIRQARPFLHVAKPPTKGQALTPGQWQPLVCGEVVEAAGSLLAGEYVQFDPSDEASLANYVAGFSSGDDAKAFVNDARTSSTGCTAPYVVGSGQTIFTPLPAPPIRKLGDQRLAFGGRLKFASGQTAQSTTFVIREGQFVDQVQMLSVRTVTAKELSKIASVIADNVAELAKRAEKVKVKKGDASSSRPSTAKGASGGTVQGELGEAVTIPGTDGVQVTVGPYDSPYQPQYNTGNRGVAIQVKVCAGNKSYFASPLSFGYHSGSNSLAGAISGGKAPALESKQLQPHECETGWHTASVVDEIGSTLPFVLVGNGGDLARWDIPLAG
jgi:hypothetical protein